MVETIIVDKKDLEEKKKVIKQRGAENFHVVSDFDRTLTKAFVNGIKTPSLISVLRDGDYISEDYAKKATELSDFYHPIELDINFPFEKKKEKMQEWWTKHFDLLIKSGLNKKHINQIIEEGKVEFRDGVKEFLDFLESKKIPLLIISSSCLGGDSIKIFLEKNKKKYDNIYIISNLYEWDEKGNAIGIKKPIIHVMNKNEIGVKNYPIFELIENRKNVLLLGDSIEDVGMVEGFDYNNLIKISFLNEDINKNLSAYKKQFDVVITGDGDFSFVNKLLKEVLK